MPTSIRRVINLLLAAAVLGLVSVPARGAEREAGADQAVAAIAAAAPAILDAAGLEAAVANLSTTPASFAVPRRPAGDWLGSGLRVGLYASFVALQALDGFSTMKALKAGGREANPVMSGVVGSPAALFAVKAGTAAATVFAAERLAKHNKIASFLMMTALNSGYAVIVAHNYQNASRR